MPDKTITTQPEEGDGMSTLASAEVTDRISREPEECIDTEQVVREPDECIDTEQIVRKPDECIDTEQVRPGQRARALTEGNSVLSLAIYGLLGVYLGVVFTQSQVISWFRIYEMFRFESFHMYGIIGTAIAVAAISIWLIKRLKITTLRGEQIQLSPKAWGTSRIPGARYWMGGIAFGLGWALLGACPGPLLALIGGGTSVMVVALGGAIVGTWTYSVLLHRLPH
ncbi:MAG: DUF6691 family protein [Bacteroidota bacterium]